MLFKDCGRTDERMDRQTTTTDRQWVITIVHLEPLAQVSQKSALLGAKLFRAMAIIFRTSLLFYTMSKKDKLK